MSIAALLVVAVLVGLTLAVLVVDVVVVNPRCRRTISAWAAGHEYALATVRRQWVGRDVAMGRDGNPRNVHSRPGGRYFVVSGTDREKRQFDGRLRIEGGFQGFGADEVVELVVREF